jgi:hypothetical protein
MTNLDYEAANVVMDAVRLLNQARQRVVEDHVAYSDGGNEDQETYIHTAGTLICAQRQVACTLTDEQAAYAWRCASLHYGWY